MAAVAGVIAAGTVQAAVITTFDLTSPTTINHQSNASSPYVISGTGGVQAKLYAWQRETNGTITFSGAQNRLNINPNGTGVNSSGDESTLDDFAGRDFVSLELGTSDWRPVSVSFFESLNLGYEIYGTNLLGNQAGTITSEIMTNTLVNLTLLAPSTFTNPDNTNDSASLAFDALVPNFRTFIFTTADGDGQNKFRITEFEGSASPVPVPAALPLLATALAGLGLLKWRRKQNAAA